MNRIVLILYFLTTSYFLYATGKLLPLDYKSTPSSVIYKAVSAICTEVLKPHEAMVLVNIGYYDSNYEREFKLHAKFTIFNMKTINNMRPFNVQDRSLITLSLFFTRSPNVLDETLKMIKYFSVNSPSRNTLLVDLSDDAENEIIPKYFQVLWQNHVVKPLIIRLRINGTERFVDIYRWSSLEPAAKCGTNTSTYKNVGFYDPRQNIFTFFESNQRFFQMRPPKKLSYCQLKVGVVIYPPFVFPAEKNVSNSDQYDFNTGFEIKLIKEVAKSFGYEIIFKTSMRPLDWGTLEANGSATGIYKDLLDGESDIGLSSFMYIPRTEFIDFGPPYAFEDMYWCVPKAVENEPWSKLFYPYRLTAFVLYQLALILTSILLCLFSNLKSSEPAYNRQLQNCILRCAADIYGNTYSIYSPKSYIVRIFYLVWLFFTVHMSVLYSGALFSKLTFQVDDSKKLTMQDILNSDLRLLFFSYTKYITADGSIPEPNTNKFEHCENLPNCLERVAIAKDSAICLTSSMVLFAINRQWAIACQKNAKLISFPVTMIFRKHHYLFKEFSKKILCLFEGGFIHYWKTQAVKFYRPGHLEFQKLDNTTVPYLSNETIIFKIIKPVFKILLCGHCLATFVFLIELIYFNKKMYLKYKREDDAADIGFKNKI